MPLRFAWDARKAAANLRKHGVSFGEAATAFGDPLSITIADPDHSVAEQRFILIGRSRNDHLVVVAYVTAARPFESSALDPPAVGNGIGMKKVSKASRAAKRGRGGAEMRAEYDFSTGVRGKYAARFAEGTNLVLLAPDVAAEFPTASAVNKALRQVIKSRTKRRTA